MGLKHLRDLLYPGGTGILSAVLIAGHVGLFSALMFGLSFIMVNRRTTKPAA